MSSNSIEREYSKFLQRKFKESQQVAGPKAKQEQVATKPKAEESVAPIA